MAEMKNLAKQTAIYGISSILGKFLNWCLVPLYTYTLTNSAEYGVVTNLYAWTALLLVILTYGMETGFFRFANKESKNANTVYSSILLCVGFTSTLFALLCCSLSTQIANGLGYNEHPEYITLLAIIVALDAFGSIPFAYLRYQNRAIKFASLKVSMILVNILFNIFFLVICPQIHQSNPEWIAWFYNPNYGVGYIFVSNLISTLFVTLLLLPQIFCVPLKLDKGLLKQILAYSLPLLIFGIAGIMNQTIDKIIFPFLIENRIEAETQLGIYGACFKIAMIMMVFTQAFRYAYEPFVFAQNKNEDKKKQYADAMKFFIIFSLLICLGMIFFIDLFKPLIRSDYWEGLKVVPIILVSYLFQGIFFNLSIWYKLTDKTWFGAIFSLIGLIITITINVLFVPHYGYMASAFASLCCYFCVMLLSYVIGQKHFPIHYDFKSISLYVGVAIILFLLHHYSPIKSGWSYYLQNSLFTLLFVGLIIKRDLPLSAIPVINRLIKK